MSSKKKKKGGKKGSASHQRRKRDSESHVHCNALWVLQMLLRALQCSVGVANAVTLSLIHI